MLSSAKSLTSTHSDGRQARVRGLEGVGVWWGGPSWIYLGRGVLEGRGELSPPLLPLDVPGAWELGVPLGGEGGPAGSQGLSYFCNPEHICHSRREGQTLGAGLECRSQAAGGAALAPLLAAQPAPALLPGEGALPRAECVAWGGTVAVMLLQCFGGVLGSGTKSKYSLHWGGEEFNSGVWGLYFMLSAMEKSGQAKPCVKGKRNSARLGPGGWDKHRCVSCACVQRSRQTDVGSVYEKQGQPLSA